MISSKPSFSHQKKNRIAIQPPATSQATSHYPLTAYLDLIAYGLIVGLMAGYACWMSDFAEIHTTLSLLPFPVFIGEWVLGGLFILAVIKFFYQRSRIHWRVGLFGLFLLFILLKALYGYKAHGALSFRHAAFFYYYCYGVFAYYFYNPHWLKSPRDKQILTALLFVIACFLVRSYYLFPLLMVIAALLARQSRIGQITLGLFVIFLFPFHTMLHTSRSALIAIAGSMLFLAFSFVGIMVKIAKRWSILIISLLILSLGLVFVKMDDSIKQRVSSIGHLHELVYIYQLLLVESNKRLEHYEPTYYPVRLYSSNDTSDISPDQNKKYYTKSYQDLLTQTNGRDPSEIKLTDLPVPINHLIERGNADHQFAYGFSTMIWRLFLWTDMLDDLKDLVLQNPMKSIIGFDFGKVLRSKRQEVLIMAFPERTGWQEPHNSILHVIYRSGFTGFLFICLFCWLFIRTLKLALKRRLIAGLFLLGACFYWILFSLTLVMFELPYYAVFFWSLAGITVAYIRGAVNGEYA